MFAKFEVFAKSGKENDYFLEDNVRLNRSLATLNNATLYWRFKNVTRNVNDTITYGGETITFGEGYWTFDMIQDKLAERKILLKFNPYDNTCKVYVDKASNFKSFGKLLGFLESQAFLPKAWKTSLNEVDINHGLRFITLNCSAVDESKNFGRDGRRSRTKFTFPILPNQNLSSAISHFGNTGSVTPIRDGWFGDFTFTIGSNLSSKGETTTDVGVDIYFEIKINV